MSARVYRDASFRKSTTKRSKVSPRIQELWDELCSLNESLHDLYFRSRYGWLGGDSSNRQMVTNKILTIVAPFLHKKDFDIDYVMHSQQYIFWQIMAYIEYEDGEPLQHLGVRYDVDYLSLGSAANLQGYLALRTKLRNYEYVETTAYSALYLYVSELLNLIGVKDEHEALKKLLWLYEQYSKKADEERETLSDEDYFAVWNTPAWEKRNFVQSLGRWIREFGWYYNCDDQINWNGSDLFSSKEAPWQAPFLEEVEKLKDIAQLSDDELVEVVLKFAGGDVNRSVFRAKYQQDFDRILIKLYRDMDARVRKRNEKSWVEKHTKRHSGYRDRSRFFAFTTFFFEEHENKSIGRKPLETPTKKVFFPKQKGTIRENTYEVVNVYIEYPSSKLHSILKYLDYALREKTKFRARIKNPDIMKSDKNLVERVITEYFTEKQQKRAQDKLDAVEINLQELESIRSNAEATRDSLLVEDDSENVLLVASRELPNISTNPAVSANAMGLTSREIDALTSLLNGAKRILSSLEIDQINEKLYDTIGDNVLGFDNNEVILYNDYIDDVKRLLS